jgi:hypothetical protein
MVKSYHAKAGDMVTGHYEHPRDDKHRMTIADNDTVHCISPDTLSEVDSRGRA